MIYTHGHGAAWYAAQIREKLLLPSGPLRTYDAIVVDPSANQVRIELSLVGLLTTTPPTRQFKDRFTVMKGLIEQHRLFVFDKPETKPWMYEVDRYEWKEGAKGEPRGDLVRGPDDAMDSSGYALLWRVPDPPIDELLGVGEGHHGPAKIDAYSAKNWKQWHELQAERAEEEPSVTEAFDPSSEDFEESFA
jgi:hypothetical protein